jgi:class 3 adenylate cyclase
MVTDLVDFTRLLRNVGDSEARRLIQLHDRLLRSMIRRNAGIEIAHTGDGVIASFNSLRNALHCAMQVQDSLALHKAQDREFGLRARIGVHAGEPLREQDRLVGIAVNVAFRVCSACAPNRVYVTETVRGLAAGLGFAFVKRRTRVLKGVGNKVPLHELKWRSHGVASGYDAQSRTRVRHLENTNRELGETQPELPSAAAPFDDVRRKRNALVGQILPQPKHVDVQLRLRNPQCLQ